MRKVLPTFLLLLAIVTIAQAGIVSWLTSKTVDWEFIQKTGGLRVLNPIVKNGRIHQTRPACRFAFIWALSSAQRARRSAILASHATRFGT